jgi:hypothetical protein
MLNSGDAYGQLPSCCQSERDYEGVLSTLLEHTFEQQYATVLLFTMGVKWDQLEPNK